MKKIWAALILFVVVSISYAPAVRNGFVWDDTALILRDPLIRSWRLIPEGFNHFLFIDATPSDFYRPLQRLTYTIDYAAAGFQPAFYHALSIFWHAVAAIAFLFFAEELLTSFGIERRRARLVSFIAALVWAIHPVLSAAVVYVSGRADPLATAFGFLGLLFLLRSKNAIGFHKLALLAGSGLALLSSAFSKEAGLIFPIIGVVLFVLHKMRADLWKPAAVVAFVCAIYFPLRSGAEHESPPQLTPPPPLLARPIIIARAVAEYAGLIVFPWNLHMDRDVETQPTGFSEASLTHAAWRELQTLLGLILIAAYFYWLWRARKRSPAVFACLVCTLITYLPVSGIVALNASVAEHWIYLPSAFLFLAVALELARLAEVLRSRRSTMAVATTALFVWIAFLGGRTFARTFDWKDQRTFFERTIVRGGDSARMLINLAGLESSEGKLPEATAHLQAALQKKPDQPLAIINLASVALKRNDFKQARDLLNRAAHMPIVDAQAHQLLAVLEHKENGKVDLMRMRLASRTGLPNWTIEKAYIQLLDETGAKAAAIDELLACLQTQWYRAASWQLLSELETKAGHADQAANALAQARDYDVHLGDTIPPCHHGDETMQGTSGESVSETPSNSSGKKSARKSTGQESNDESAASPSSKNSSHGKGTSEGTSETSPTPGGEQE